MVRACLLCFTLAAHVSSRPVEIQQILHDGVTDQPSRAAIESAVFGGRLGQLKPGELQKDEPVLRASLHADDSLHTWLISAEGVPCMIPFRFGGKVHHTCHPDGWCCLDPGCVRTAACSMPAAVEPMPLTRPRDRPRQDCILPTLSGTFEVSDETTVFLLQDVSPATSWDVEDLRQVVLDKWSDQVRIVFLSYDPEESYVRESMMQLRSQLNSSLGGHNLHFVTQPAWHIPVEQCWLPSVVHAWSKTQGIIAVSASATGPPLLTASAKSAQGHWARALKLEEGAESSPSGPIRWAGLSCGPDIEEDSGRPPPSQNLTGTVALVARGHCSFYRKVHNVKAAGAVAVIIFSQDEPIAMGCSAPDPCSDALDITAVMVGRQAGEKLLTAMFTNSSSSSSSSSEPELVAHFTGQPQGPDFVGFLGVHGGIWSNGGIGLSGLTQEVLGMEYQLKLADHVKELQVAEGIGDVWKVEVFKDQLLPTSLIAEWDSQNAMLLRNGGYDSLEIELHLDCADHADENCAAWDQELNLFFCREGVTSDPTHCQDRATTIGRWITPYGREGRWISDMSAALPLLLSIGESDESATLHLATWQQHIVTLILWFRSSQTGSAPLAQLQLWDSSDGGRFNLDYNPSHAPIYFEVPEDVTGAKLNVLLTGHGWGADRANCAEFCDHTHWFSINGMQDFVKSSPSAGTDQGCLKQVSEGVVPNQHGTWPFGRAGWCPGKQVDWWSVDVTQWLLTGSVNNITYRAFFNGTEYDPVADEDGHSLGFPAEIHLTSVLTFFSHQNQGTVQLLNSQSRVPTLLL